MKRTPLLPLLGLLLACAGPAKADVFSDEPYPADLRNRTTRGAFSDERPSEGYARPPQQRQQQEEDVELVESYEPSVGAVLGALAINLVYVPVRFAITVVGAFAGGLEGIFSVGDVDATDKIFGLTDGSQVITPAMLEGRERWSFSRYD